MECFKSPVPQLRDTLIDQAPHPFQKRSPLQKEVKQNPEEDKRNFVNPEEWMGDGLHLTMQ